MAEKSVSVRLSARVDSYVAAMKRAEASTTGFSRGTKRNLQQVGTQMQNVGRSATMFVTAPLALMGAGAVKAAIDWESAWAGVTKTVDGTVEQMAGLEQGLRDMAKELPATHGEIAAVAEAAGALGVAAGDIEAFTRVAIDLGETTNLSADEAATGLAQLMNVMGTAGGDIDRLGSTLVDLGNNGASTEAQILDMATRIAASGQIVGLTEDEVLSFANALASVGIEAEAGGSAFSRVIQDMAKAAQTGGDELRTFAEVSGMSAQQFATAFREDPSAAIVAFVSGLGDIQAAGGNVFGVLEELGLSDVRVSRALLSMATSGDVLTESLARGEQAWADNTALADEAEKRYATTGARFEMVRNQLVDLGIDIGRILLPALEAVVSFASEVIGVFQSLPGPVQTALVAFAGVAAVMGPLVFLGGSLVKNFVAIRSAMSLAGPAATTASKAFAGIGLALTAGIIGYQVFTAEQRKTDAVTRNTSAALLGEMAALFAAGDAAGFAAGEIDAVAVAQEALSLALADGFEGLSDAFATFNLDASQMMTIIGMFDEHPVTALDNLARSFGFTAEQAAVLSQVNFDAFGMWRQNFDGVAAAAGIAEADFLAFGQAVNQLQFQMDNVDVRAIAREFLNAQVTAGGMSKEMVLAAEAVSGHRRQTGDAVAVLFAWTQQMASADQVTRDAVFGSEEYAGAIASLPPELQALISGAEGAAAAVGELEGVQASTIDTMSRLEAVYQDQQTMVGIYADALDRALGSSRDWVRAHDGFAEALLGFADATDRSSDSLDYNTEAGLTNRAAVFDLADDLIRLTESNISAGKSQDEVNREYKAGREALLDAAQAAGLNRDEVDALISQYGLVPELVTTQISIAGRALAQWQIDRYLDKLDTVPPEVATQIEAALRRGDVEEAIRILNSIPDPTVNINVRVRTTRYSVSTAGGTAGFTIGAQASADGRFVRGGSNMLSTLGERRGSRGDEVVLPLGDPGRMGALLGLSEVGPRVAAVMGRLMPAPAFPMFHAPSGGGGGGATVNTGDIYVGSRADAAAMTNEFERLRWLAGVTG